MAQVQLIKSPVIGGLAIEDKWYLPLELLWIGTYLEQFGHEVEVLDGQVMETEEICRRIHAPVIGIGFHLYSASSIDVVVRAAKQKGTLVIVGGQAATPLADQLLSGNSGIDAVVCGDGEEALRQIADAVDAGRDPFVNTANVVYWRKGEIVRNRVDKIPVGTLPIPNRRLSGINMERYIANFSKTNSFLAFDGARATNAHTKKGCPRRCTFCGRIDKIHRARSPWQTFAEYAHLVREFQVDYIFDHSDTWAINSQWLAAFRRVYERERGLKARLAVFADLRDLSPTVIADMGAVGIDTVEIGVESGHEVLLRDSDKLLPREEVIHRITALTTAGFKVEASYVLGLPGESHDSIKRTLDLSRQLRDLSERVRSYFNIVMPLPGTLIWEKFVHDAEMKEKYGRTYVFDIESLRRDFLARHCKLGDDAYGVLSEERERFLLENGLRLMEYAR